MADQTCWQLYVMLQIQVTGQAQNSSDSATAIYSWDTECLGKAL